MKKDQGQIKFHFLKPIAALKQRNQLKAYIQALFWQEKRQLKHLDYIFCTDEYLLKLNQEHLKHDTFTDIITFELSAPLQPVVSEIYISTERVQENAKSFGTTFIHELHRVIFHGVLHLCGYKDKTLRQQQEMRSKEDIYLKKYFRST